MQSNVELYEHTGASPCRGYRGRLVRVVSLGVDHVAYEIVRQPPGYRMTRTRYVMKRENFARQYKLHDAAKAGKAVE